MLQCFLESNVIIKIQKQIHAFEFHHQVNVTLLVEIITQRRTKQIQLVNIV